MRVPRLLAVSVAAATVLVCGAGGAAVAFVSGGGRGSGAAVVTRPNDVRVVAEPVAGLYPGGPVATVPVSVTNTDDLPFEISHLTPDLDALPAACPTSSWTLTVPEALPTVPPARSVVVPVGVSLKASAPAACQGQQFVVTYSVTGRLG